MDDEEGGVDDEEVGADDEEVGADDEEGGADDEEVGADNGEEVGVDDEAEGRVSIQLRSSRPPAAPDFSGWNWVDHIGPCSTAATKRSPPCSAQVSLASSGQPSAWCTP